MIQPDHSGSGAGAETEYTIAELFQHLKQRDDNAHASSQYFGKYQIRDLVGFSKNSAVLLTYDPDLRRQVVLKVYRPELPTDQKDTILDEGRALARIDCTHVARCLAVESLEECPYLVLEYVPGSSLDQLPLPLPTEEALEITRQVAKGVQAVHERGLLHLDLKPSNAILQDDGTVKLVDFGLAQPISDIRFGHISGTPAFMAPEVAKHEIAKIDRRSDVFGIGAILYCLLTGQPPFTGESAPEVLHNAQTGEIRPPAEIVSGISQRAATICQRCMDKNASNRFADVGSLQKALEPGRPPMARRVLAIVFAILVIGFFSWWILASQSTREFADLKQVLVQLLNDDTRNLAFRNDFRIEIVNDRFHSAGDRGRSSNPVVVQKNTTEFLQIRPQADCYVAVYSVEYENGDGSRPIIVALDHLGQTLFQVNAGQTRELEISFGVLTPAGKREFIVVVARTRPWDEFAIAESARQQFRNNNTRGTGEGNQQRQHHQSIAIFPYRVVPTAQQDPKLVARWWFQQERHP